MIADNISSLKQELSDYNFTLVAVSKTKPQIDIQKAYDSGQRVFGENKVQELVDKFEALPKDIEWHMIGHLQSNKVKYIAPFVSLIHAVDSKKLLKEIQKQALKNNRTLSVLLQVHIAEETTKFGLDKNELEELLPTIETAFPNVRVKGLMGMATNSEDEQKVRTEFAGLKSLYDLYKNDYSFDTLSMGMSGDYHIALEEGSNMIRVGSKIFGARNYNI